jgi:hypothetical protein
MQTKAGYANKKSEDFGVEVVPAEHADVSEGDTLYFAQQGGETQAYVAKGNVPRTKLAEKDEIRDWGKVLDDPDLGVTANVYDLNNLDEISAYFEADVAFEGTGTQRRDESTEVSLEDSQSTPSDGFISRTLEEGTFGELKGD